MNHLIIIIDNIVKVNSFSSNYSVLKTNHIQVYRNGKAFLYAPNV